MKYDRQFELFVSDRCWNIYDTYKKKKCKRFVFPCVSVEVNNRKKDRESRVIRLIGRFKIVLLS